MLLFVHSYLSNRSSSAKIDQADETVPVFLSSKDEQNCEFSVLDF
jgi:hypothetical protein